MRQIHGLARLPRVDRARDTSTLTVTDGGGQVRLFISASQEGVQLTPEEARFFAAALISASMRAGKWSDPRPEPTEAGETTCVGSGPSA